MGPTRFSESDAARLLMQHRQAIYSYIFACVRKHADAEDIFQDVSVAVVKSISKLQTEEGFFPWVREIAFRRVLDYFKTIKRESPVSPHVVAALADAAGVVEKSRSLSRRREALLECMEKLPPQSQKLVTLRYSDNGKSIGDIAREEGKTTKSVYSKLERIREILRNCILSSQKAEEF